MYNHCSQLVKCLWYKTVPGFAVLVIFSTLLGCDTQDPDIVAGQEVVNGTCKVCHAQGINGAPIIGNRKMWRERADQGLPVLVEHAMNGHGLMPARGGNESLSDQQITQAIKYMLAQLEDD